MASTYALPSPQIKPVKIPKFYYEARFLDGDLIGRKQYMPVYKTGERNKARINKTYFEKGKKVESNFGTCFVQIEVPYFYVAEVCREPIIPGQIVEYRLERDDKRPYANGK